VNSFWKSLWNCRNADCRVKVFRAATCKFALCVRSRCQNLIFLFHRRKLSDLFHVVDSALLVSRFYHVSYHNTCQNLRHHLRHVSECVCFFSQHHPAQKTLLCDHNNQMPNSPFDQVAGRKKCRRKQIKYERAGKTTRIQRKMPD
jgi:hypothetical protein